MQSKEVREVRLIGPRCVSKRGGSLQVTIPPEIRDHLGIKEGTKVSYVIDPETGYVTFARADGMEIKLTRLGKPATLGFTVPRKVAKKLARRK